MNAEIICAKALRVLSILFIAIALNANLPAQNFTFQELHPIGSGKTGFTEMGPSRTGIAFTNSLPRSLMIQNYNLMNGSGVAAGDFDADGKCDLYFCAINGTNRLYRNLGNWQFEDVTASAGVGCAGLHSTGAIFADIDGDGRLDLLVATLGSGVHSFINDGRGHFIESTVEAGLVSQTGSMSLAMADVDGDGDLDLYVANYGALSILRSGGHADIKQAGTNWVVTGPYASRLRFVEGRLEERGEPDVLYFNDGHGHFTAAPWNSNFFLDEDGKPAAEPWDYGLSVQMRDINGDGFPDIYVCNDFQTVDRIWINDGHGHFRALPRLAMRKQSFSSMGVDFADIDRDGFLDFFVTEMMSREHASWMREVSGMEPTVPLPGRFENRPQVVRNTLFCNRGDNTFTELANYAGVAASDWSWQPVFLDVDLDGYEDLLIVNGAAFDVQDRDTLSRIRSFGRQSPEQSRTNLLLYPPSDTPNAAFRNRHDWTFEDSATPWGFDSRRISQGVALADLDNDGDLDVIINCLNDGPLLYRNDGSRPRLAVRLEGLKPNACGVGAMVRVRGGVVPEQMQEIICGGRYLSGDDTMRVFAAGTNDMTIEVAWRNGKKSVIEGARANRLYVVQEPASPPNPAAPPRPLPAPFFRDVSERLGHFHHEELFNDYLRQPLLTKQLSQLGPAVAWVDLDGDGHDELVLGTGRGGSPGIYRINEASGFTRVPATLVAPDDTAGFAAWSSGEGRRSLLVGLASYEAKSPAAVLELTMTNSTIVHHEIIANGDASTGPLAVADIDGDGDLDLFVGGRVVPGSYPQAAPSRVFRQENGGFVPDKAMNVVLEKAGLVSGAVWSDLDGDGFPELILACEWGPVRVFKNDRGNFREITSELGLSPFTGWWNGVTTGDFDGDGRLDIVASNWGLNDAGQTAPEHPLQIYFGRGEGKPGLDLIEAYYAPELDADVPRRSLNALSQAFPVLAEHYPTHRAFSTATLPGILRVVPLKMESVAVTTSSSMVFLNRGTNFVAVPLPREAQLAPAFGINVGDANGDGNEDIFLSQNFFALRPEWPRQDGGRGLWLLGDGAGGFRPMPGQESGVMVYGEQRGSALGDFNEDGRVDLVVTQNGAATRLFENVRARPGLRVRLSAGPGNPMGIGAVLRLECGGKLGPAREVHGASGYWSQDSVVQVLACPQTPASILVRWPGGNTTTVPVPQGAREVRVEHH